jgi:hypothetical protein
MLVTATSCRPPRPQQQQQQPLLRLLLAAHEQNQAPGDQKIRSPPQLGRSPLRKCDPRQSRSSSRVSVHSAMRLSSERAAKSAQTHLRASLVLASQRFECANRQGSRVRHSAGQQHGLAGGLCAHLIPLAKQSAKVDRLCERQHRLPGAQVQAPQRQGSLVQ